MGESVGEIDLSTGQLVWAISGSIVSQQSDRLPVARLADGDIAFAVSDYFQESCGGSQQAWGEAEFKISTLWVQH